MMKYLIELGESREVFSSEENRFTPEMKSEMKTLMDIQSDFIVQLYDKEWESFVNLKFGDILNDRQKLKCILKNDPREEAPVSLNGENVQSAESVSTNGEISSNNKVEMSPVSKTVVPNVKGIDLKMTESLRDCLKNGQNLDWAKKHELLQLLTDALYRINKYPPKDVKEKVAQNLVNTYPQLKERLGTGWDGWVIRLDNSLKSRREKDPDFEGRKRKRVSVHKEDEPAVAKRGAINWNPEVMDDEQMILSNQTELKRETMKGEKSQNKDKVKELMDMTYPHRRQQINSGVALVEVKESYPALFTEKGVYEEFGRLMAIDIDTIFLRTFPDMARKLINLTRERKKKTVEMTAILSDLDSALSASKDEGVRIHDSHMMTAALRLVPLLLKEDPGSIYKELKEEEPSPDDVLEEMGNAAPTLAVAGNPFNSSLIYIVGEESILMECCEFSQAVCLLFGLYYILNLEYPKEGKKTFTFLQKCVFGIKDKEKIPPSINSLLSALN